MPFTVRGAVQTDISAIAEIAQQTFALAGPPNSDLREIKSYVATYLSEAAFAAMLSSQQRITVACDENVVAGFCVLNPRGDTPAYVSKEPAIELSKFYLTAAFHGRGLGQLLMQDAVAFAKEENFEFMWLSVFSGNQRARGFYNKCGFVAVGDCYFEMGCEWHLDKILTLALR